MGDCDSKLQQATINLPSSALICERFQLSDRAGAAVANAVIKDLKGMVQPSQVWHQKIAFNFLITKQKEFFAKIV